MSGLQGSRRILLVASRPPWPPHSGDRLRALVWLEALRGKADVTFAGPATERPPEGVSYQIVRQTLPALARAATRTLLGRLPLHFMIAGRYDWAPLDSAGEFDIAIVVLSRCDPWVRPKIRAKRVILDAVDSLTLNMRERVSAASGLRRRFWRGEEMRTRRAETHIGVHYDRVVVVSEEERQLFGPNCEVISNGVEIGTEPDAPRQIDFGFWGRLAYFSNLDAARRLRTVIWPLIREAHPEATLLIAGADAPPEVLAWHGSDGITVVSPMIDRDALIRNVKIAIMPVAYGSGQASKLLEAFEAGCAVVALEPALRGLTPRAPVEGCGSAESLAARAIALLYTPEEIASLARACRRWVMEHYSRAESRRRMAALALDSK